jgi:hypothetical protein
LSPEIATFVNIHVLFSVSRIIMSGLLLGMVLSVWNCWFHSILLLLLLYNGYNNNNHHCHFKFTKFTGLSWKIFFTVHGYVLNVGGRIVT